MAWQYTSPEVTVKVFKMYCLSNTMDETDDVLWNDSEELGIFGVSVRNMKALTVKVETVTLVRIDRI
jgi:hypothetical protein